ncbi:MAG: [FeFe] hydrogenase H-cluster radical SAM maturase HydE [Ignavibacteria bacterium]|nr:[FeFe] hydrogenase H-cluster radical SAM maturase HydE [Ignavibacteria bacterium]
MEKLTKILQKDNLTKEDIVFLLSLEEPESIEMLRSYAYNIMRANVGEYVYLRGLIEFSNICVNDCYYCGIRKSNRNIKRYTLESDEILECARFAAQNGYGSIVLQSGERRDPQFIDYICRIIEEIKSTTKSENLPNGLGITLCVGEQTYATYKKFFEAGAHRYLLRIETTNPSLFARIHPADISFEKRMECLFYLKEIGFQVGTGVMIGLPTQTVEDLANDLWFFKELDADMIGMGPYIVHRDTPFNIYEKYFLENKRKIYLMSLKMIAVARILLKDVNIASTTALQALYPLGREEGLRFGANVVMPLLTPSSYRRNYILYDGKPCVDEFTNDCGECLISRIEKIHRPIGFDNWGDSLHFKKKH